ncbi:TetR family transcriptional regulator C-terminal domain-containing protein [Bizionia sp. KMM 8389]
MAKKKNITNDKLITFYMDYVLTHNQEPESVYAFAKAFNFNESDFYKHFTTFKVLEKTIFKTFLENTINLLEQNESYLQFDARNKLLSFYFTLFENLTANRSYGVYALESKNLKSLTTLSELRKAFKEYINSLPIDMVEIKEPRITKIQNMSVQESFWVQFLVVLKFWLNDESPAFEKTDLFIEKSVQASFDLMEIKPLKSVLDLGKFIYKETMQ